MFLAMLLSVVQGSVIAFAQAVDVEAEDAARTNLQQQQSSDASNGFFVEFSEAAEGFGVVCSSVSVTRGSSDNEFQITSSFSGAVTTVEATIARFNGEEAEFSRWYPQLGQQGSAVVPEADYVPGVYQVDVYAYFGEMWPARCKYIVDTSQGWSNDTSPGLFCSIASDDGDGYSKSFLTTVDSLNTDEAEGFVAYGISAIQRVPEQSGYQVNYEFKGGALDRSITPRIVVHNDHFGSVMCFGQNVTVPGDANQQWNPPAGLRFVNPKPWVDQLDEGISSAQVTQILDSYSTERFNQAQNAGLNPKQKVIHTHITPPEREWLLDPWEEMGQIIIDPASEVHAEKYRLMAHTTLDTWSRIPLEIESLMHIDIIQYFYALPWAGAQVQFGWSEIDGEKTNFNVEADFRIDYQGYNDFDNKLNASMYEWQLSANSHEFGHIFHFSIFDVLEDRTGDDFMFVYPEYAAVLPSWFDAYGNPDNLRIDSFGNLISLPTYYANTNIYEDLAEVIEPFFHKTAWYDMESRITGPDADLLLKAKFDFILAEFQKIDPDITYEAVRQWSQLPSYTPPLTKN